MEPIFKSTQTVLQQNTSSRFNFTCIDCCDLIIAIGTDIGSCYLYSIKTLSLFGQIIYLPNLPHSNQNEKKLQSIITSCKFSGIQHEKNFILLLIGTKSGHLHLYNIDILNCKSIKVQTIKVNESGDCIQSLLWCKLEKLMNNYNNFLHQRGSQQQSQQQQKQLLDDNLGNIQSAPIESLKIIVSMKCGKIYLLHIISNYLNNRDRNEQPVKIVNVQLIHKLKDKNDNIIQTSFKTHFVLISCLKKCFILDFSKIYNISLLNEKKREIKNDKKEFSLPFVNGANMESMKYFINIYQIGTKTRNGYFGACFDCQSIDGCDQILSARKSGRIWVGQTQTGQVINTLRFKLPKIPNIFKPTTSDINTINDIIWNKELLHIDDTEDNNDNDNNNDFDNIDYEFSNVSDIFCQQLGILIPFGNWTLSYTHPNDVNDELNLNNLKFNQLDKKNKRINYHQKLNNFGLKILDHNIPKLLQWYPNLGKVVDISVLETQCCFYILYKPLLHDIDNNKNNESYCHLAKIELCSPIESIQSLIDDNKLTIAIDCICAYKVIDIDILQNVEKLLNDEEITKNLHKNTIQKFNVHYREIKQLYDKQKEIELQKQQQQEQEQHEQQENNSEIKPDINEIENDQDEEKKIDQHDDTINDEDNRTLFTKYRKASLDYVASHQTQQLTDRRNLNWEPAKFDVKDASEIIINNNNDDQDKKEGEDDEDDDEDEEEEERKEKETEKEDIWSTKNFLKMGKKMVKQISQTTNSIKADLMGNSPRPSPQPPLPPIDMSQDTEIINNEIDKNEQQDKENEIEREREKEKEKEMEEYEAMDKFPISSASSLQSVQSIDYKQKQRVARARRKSSANQQIFNEADEQEPIKMVKSKKSKKKRLKKKKSKSKSKFASIDPAPKVPLNSNNNKGDDVLIDETTNNINDNNENNNDDNDDNDNDNSISITVNSSSGSILDINPNIKPHEVIYDDDGNLMKINENNDNGNIDNDYNDNDEIEIDINKIHILLKQTSKCDVMLRRRMRNELEEVRYDDDNNDMEYIDDENKTQQHAKVGLSNINYKTSRNLMNKMSNLLGEYEKLSFNGLQHILFYKWRNKIGEKLSTVLTRMLCVFISVKIDIGKEKELSVLEILKKFLLILDFEWVLKLCNTHKLFNILRQLATLQYEQNNRSFNRIEIEKTYLEQNYKSLIKLIDTKYHSPLLLLQYLPLLIEKGFSELCIEISVAYFPYISPWFIRKYMYRFAMDNNNNNNNNNNNLNIFKSYLKYLKLLFNIHPRTRCNGVFVLDLITLTLSLNRPLEKELFITINDIDNDSRYKYINKITKYEYNRIPLIHSENKYADIITKYILSIINDKSYYIEWSYLEIIFKQYGFWKGLYKIYFHFNDIKSLIILCIFLDYAQPILNLLCDLSSKYYWKYLIKLYSIIHENKNKPNNRLNFEIIIRFMMKNIGPQKTLSCLNDKKIIEILKNIDNIDNIIYKELVLEKESNFKRDKLIYSVKQSLSTYLLSQYNISNKQQQQQPQQDTLNNLLLNIKHSSDEWQLMSSVNIRPPNQRAAAPLEKNLTDLFVQFV